MSNNVDVLKLLDYMIGQESRLVDLYEARTAVAELIDVAALVLAQAKEGHPLDLIALSDCIDLAGGKEVRKAQRARVKGASA